MHALLILDKKNGNARIMVSLKRGLIREQVILLLEENRSREAFDLLKARAEVEAYLPVGTKLPRVPQVTLVEDLL